ncbi:MAG TPA: PAC2 family protein [Acidimicrobiales bacterium]|nr:PAC2 family protein [Acidimicrobiales bacterium]
MASLVQVNLLRWEHQPTLRQPALVAAFEGWNDAGNAASGAVTYLAKAWEASPFAVFDAEELFDFTSARPVVNLESGVTRRLQWPCVSLSAAEVPGLDRDVVFVSGPEPQLRWRSFSRELVAACLELGVASAVLLGALLADVAHTRPVRVGGGATTARMAALAGIDPSYYGGPTGIVGVMADALAHERIPTASLWASVPHYVSQSSSPKATLALVERAGRLLGAKVDTVDLQLAAAAYERQVNELVALDEDASAYVRRLEREDAEDQEREAAEGRNRPGLAGERLSPASGERLGPASGERLAAEVERYLREHRGD